MHTCVHMDISGQCSGVSLSFYYVESWGSDRLSALMVSTFTHWAIILWFEIFLLCLFVCVYVPPWHMCGDQRTCGLFPSTIWSWMSNSSCQLGGKHLYLLSHFTSLAEPFWWLPFLKSTYYNYMCMCVCMMCYAMQKSENHFWESDCSFYCDPEIELRLLGLPGRHFYLLCHCTGLCLAFYVGARDPNSGPHIYAVGTLSMEPSPLHPIFCCSGQISGQLFCNVPHSGFMLFLLG